MRAVSVAPLPAQSELCPSWLAELVSRAGYPSWLAQIWGGGRMAGRVCRLRKDQAYSDQAYSYL